MKKTVYIIANENNTKETSKETAKILKKKGSVVIYPTETSYGIGCLSSDKKAIEKIYKIKCREKNKKMLVIVANKKMLKKLFFVSKKLNRMICDLMPGPLSLILKEKKSGEMICVRVTSNLFAARLSYEAGEALISTSANIAGNKNAYSISEIPKRILDKVDVVVDYGKLRKIKPSTIYNPLTNKILRKGPISKNKIEKVMK